MSRREPMEPVQGLKKPTLPPPMPRPRTLASVPSPTPDPAAPLAEEGAAAEECTAVGAPAQRSQQAGDIEGQKATRPKRSRPEKTSTSTRSAGVSASADTMKPVSVSVPFTLAEAWRDRAKKDRASQVDVLLDAIVAHQGELDELVAASTEKPTMSDGLFDRGPRTKGERYVGVSLRIKARNLEVIDRLAEKHGPVKRSPFVAAVLTAYLA